MDPSEEKTPDKIFDSTKRIIGKIRELQNEASDLLSMVEEIPDTIEVASDGLKIPFQWANATAFDLLSSVEFPDGSISTTGNGPWSEADMDELIRSLNNEVYEVKGSVYIVVVGYDATNIDEIREHIENSENIVQIYPQELFLSYLFTGVDPLSLLSGEQSEHWIEFHPVLRELFGKEQAFPWPLIQPNEDDEDQEAFDNEEIPSRGLTQSPLNIMGYRAGVTRGLSDSARRSILKKALLGKIPEVEEADGVDTEAYMAQWGNPNTARRLWRIAKHLAALCYNARKNRNYEAAKVDWESDLEWLYDNFYEDGDYGFTWPG
jgi:hypothetical protein